MAGHIQVISRTTLDCQGGSQGGGISARALALARPGVAPPLCVDDASFCGNYNS